MEAPEARPTGRVIQKRGAPAPASEPPATAAPAPAEVAGADGIDEACLVLFPSGAQGDPTPAQRAALTKALSWSDYDARLRARAPLPRVVFVGPTAEALAHVDTLRAAGLETTAFDADLILGPLQPFRVRGVRSVEGKLHLTGPRGEVRVDLSQPVLLVAGRFAFQAKAGLGIIGQAQEKVLFGHLYAGGTNDPLELFEKDISDFEVLGAARSMVGKENFGKLLELIRKGAGVTYDDALLQHSNRIGESTVASSSAGSVSSTMSAADVLSRVTYHLWRSGSGHSPETLARSLEVLSVIDAPEERVAAAFGGGPTTAMTPEGYSRMGGAAPAGSPRPGGPAATAGSTTARAGEEAGRTSGRSPASAACTTCGPGRPVPPMGRCGVCGRAFGAVATKSVSPLRFILPVLAVICFIGGINVALNVSGLVAVPLFLLGVFFGSSRVRELVWLAQKYSPFY